MDTPPAHSARGNHAKPLPPRASYLWAMLLARIYESQAQGWPAWRAEMHAFHPLRCGKPVRIIALVTEYRDV